MTFKLASILPVWLLAVAGSLLVGLLAPADRYLSLPMVFAAAIVVTFVIQLAVPRKEGLVLRVMASVGGAVLILAVATGVLALLGA